MKTPPPIQDEQILAAQPDDLIVQPELSFWQIWNMCLGFMGIQFGFALQNANVSRIFQTLGANLDDIPVLWIAAPLTGLIVQPIIGYASDRTWTRLGRRRPYFLIGAVLSAIALIVMPHASALWMAALLLWLLDASINVSMEPFRAFVSDQLPAGQRSTGYAMQSFFIGVGAVVASMLPFLLSRAGVSNTVDVAHGDSLIPDTVRFSFYIGAAVLFAAVGWTVIRSREYPPNVLHRFTRPTTHEIDGEQALKPRSIALALAWLVVGAIAVAFVRAFHLDKQLYLLCAGCVAWGGALLVQRVAKKHSMFGSIMHELQHMPIAMRRLIPVQFFSWLALFSMWIYTTGAVTQFHFGTTDTTSSAYNEGANWVGVLFAAYNGFAALAAVVIPWCVRKLGLRVSHLINLSLGAVGLISFRLIADPQWLILSMLGVGFAWASILSLPYAMLSRNVPAEKMGLYMGIFNFFIVIPQLVAASVLGFVLNVAFAGAPIYALVLGGIGFLIAGIAALRVPLQTPELVVSSTSDPALASH
jgi:maltose/moltooligosaccharide transporter